MVAFGDGSVHSCAPNWELPTEAARIRKAESSQKAAEGREKKQRKEHPPKLDRRLRHDTMI